MHPRLNPGNNDSVRHSADQDLETGSKQLSSRSEKRKRQRA